MNNELYHWKYVKKQKIQGKWKYWYNLPTMKSGTKLTVNSTSNKSSTLVETGKQKLNKLTENSASNNKVDHTIKNVKQAVHKYVEKIPTNGDEYRYFYSDKAYKAYVNATNTVGNNKDTNVNYSVSDVAKGNAKNFVANALDSGIGKAVFNVALPAFTALQVELDTPDSFKDLKKISADSVSNDEHQSAINPNYDPYTYDNSMNCSFCTAAYDLRKRGYDVEANPISALEGYTIDDIRSWYDNPPECPEVTLTHDTESDVKLFESTLKNYGDGARGHLCLYWTGGGGHDVIWEVENGEVIIRDCQTNQVVEPSEYLSLSSAYTFMRTDNLEPNENVLRTVRNRNKR